MKKSTIAAILFFGVVGAGVAAYKATKKEEADILLDKEEVQSVALDVFQREAASGYQLAIFEEMPEALKKVLFGNSEDGVAEEGFKFTDGVCGLTDPKSKTIYIFVDSFVMARKMLDKKGIKMSNIKLVEHFVLHECRHSMQFASMEANGIDIDAVFKYECSFKYGEGMMERDANAYAQYPKLYGFFISPARAAKSMAVYAAMAQ